MHCVSSPWYLKRRYYNVDTFKKKGRGKKKKGVRVNTTAEPTGRSIGSNFCTMAPTAKDKKTDSKANSENVAQDKDQIQNWVNRAIGKSKKSSATTREDEPSKNSFLSFLGFKKRSSDDHDATSSSTKASQSTSSQPVTDSSGSSSSLQETITDPNTTQTDFDRALAAELNHLSLEERNRNYEEIHGVATVEEEKPQFLQEKLSELQSAIDETPYGEKQMYQQTIEEDPLGRVYLTSPRFQLQFLRAERFDATKAATRMLLCCEKKAQFFGPKTVGRALRLSDLTSKEMKTLKAGAFQVLPQRDRSGRLIVIDTSLCGPKLYTDMFSYYKCFWYIILSVMEDDEESQKRGIVGIVWWMHHPLRLEQDFDSDLRQETIASLQWLPMRPYSSTHVCFESSSPMKQIMSRFMMAVSPKDMRYGIQLQKGTTHTEVLYKLMTYGIPVDVIPVTNSGVVKTKDFGRWIQKRRAKDLFLKGMEDRRQAILLQQQGLATASALIPESLEQQCRFLQGRTDLPSNDDVLLGTGKFLMKHPGNLHFRATVDALAELYDATDHVRDKADMTWGVVRHIQNQCGGKFLKKDNSAPTDWWIVASDKEAREKTGKIFISVRGVNRKKNSYKGPSKRSPSTITMTTSTSASTSAAPIAQVPGTTVPMPSNENLLEDARVSPSVTLQGNGNNEYVSNKRFKSAGGGASATASAVNRDELSFFDMDCFPTTWCTPGGSAENADAGTGTGTGTALSISFVDRQNLFWN